MLNIMYSAFFVLNENDFLKIGKLDIGEKLIVAPMAEISDAPFRRICKEFGAGVVFTQMVSAEGVKNANFETLRLLTFHKSEKPIGVQLLGKDPEILGRAVKELLKISPDWIDLNCGCPVSKVVNNGMGASILDDPKLLEKLISAMKKNAGDIPITIKMRLGKNKSNINVIENSKIAEENGASAIIIHARTREERYEFHADWEWIKKVKESVSIPVIGNGSIFTPMDAIKMKKETGCDGVLTARGVIGNPFLLERYNQLIETGVDPGTPNPEKVKKICLKHVDFIFKEYGEIAALDRAKKTIIWYFRHLNGIDLLLERIFSIKSINGLLEYIELHSEEIAQGNFSDEIVNEIDKKFKDRIVFWNSD